MDRLANLVPGRDDSMTCEEANVLICDNNELGTCCPFQLGTLVECVLPFIIEGCALRCGSNAVFPDPEPETMPQPEPELETLPEPESETGSTSSSGCAPATLSIIVAGLALIA